MIELKNNLSEIKVQDEPYPYFVLDDAIDEAVLNTLKKDIREFDCLIEREESDVKPLSPVFREGEPIGDLIGLGTGSAGEVVDSVFLKALDENSSAWVLLNKYFTSEFFLKEVLKLFFASAQFRKTVMTRFNFIKLKPRLKSRDYERGVFDFLFRRDFHLSIRFSRYTNNAGTTIHRDNSAKVMAFLLYLDTADWEDNFKGGFTVYDNSNAKYLCAPQYNRLSPENEKKLTEHKYVEYKENRLLGFYNTPNSWHGAPPAVLGNGVNRDCFQINLFYCTKKNKNLEIIYKTAIYFRNIVKKLFGIHFSMR